MNWMIRFRQIAILERAQNQFLSRIPLHIENRNLTEFQFCVYGSFSYTANYSDNQVCNI